MIIVGELINASRKAISQAIKDNDIDYIRKVAKEQQKAGADYIDVNAGIFVGKESDYLKWLVQGIQSELDVPCCIDSPDPKAIEAALAVHKGSSMINSISLEKERYEAILPIIAGTDLKVVALCMDSDGMPETADERLRIADKLVNGLLQHNILIDNIYIDPLVQPIGTNDTFGFEFLDSIQAITTRFKGIHTMCGLSNISFGLPARKFINQTFAIMAICKGLDGLIVNPLDKAMMAGLITAETLAGRDEFCMNYLQAYRNSKIDLSTP
ncbi:methyltetrahydrofolate cobalamin methyltransferase [Clostridium sp. PL3]|uniref:Methyltetrahydrofolate cobalamin methyltransferase n=1 Tax=Clostridium thailandense TaxID=2794346 RepID=A0A949WRF2_9CLOT|nr:methyltetrahydrofolate cobalamin methyltransferase [Clostridium thailandense]MBV7273950.1 methyltetrahydrofolate cobalamin methyltransferase [Clostridium thailandense]